MIGAEVLRRSFDNHASEELKVDGRVYNKRRPSCGPGPERLGMHVSKLELQERDLRFLSLDTHTRNLRKLATNNRNDYSNAPLLAASFLVTR